MMEKIKALHRRACKNFATTMIAAIEGMLLSVSAEALFDLTNKQRAAVLGMAFLRALFGAFTADAKKEEK